MTKVLGLGDNVCDVYLNTGVMYPGGQAFNFAVYAGMLKAESDFLGVVGTDGIGRHILKMLEKCRIGHSHLRIIPDGENGFACVTLENGDRVFRGSNRGGVIQQYPIILSEDDLKYIDTFSVVHTTNNGFLDAELPKLKESRPFVSYDFSYHWDEEERVDRVCPYVDFAFLSCSDLDEEKIWKVTDHLQDKGCGVVIATRGSKGAYVWDGVKRYRQLSHFVTPVDTLGAGDAFATAVLVTVAEYFPGLPDKKLWDNPDVRQSVLPTALERAAEFSSQICLFQGGSGGGVPIPESMMPRIREIAKL